MTNPVDDGLPQHVFRWLESAQRRVGQALSEGLDDSASAVGPRRLRILQLISPGGTRQQTLADRALVTKQAMAELVEALEVAGLVERKPDPRDGRAWLVVRTAHGDEVSGSVDRCLEVVELKLSSEVGAARYDTFKAVLREIGDEQI